MASGDETTDSLEDLPAVVPTIYGLVLQSSKRRVDLTYDYEHAQISAFRRIAAAIDAEVMVDVGANIGIYAIHVSGVPSITSIDAFEPSQATFAELCGNVEIQTDPERFRLHKIALSDRRGAAELTLYGEMAGNNALTETDPGAGGRPTETVETDLLDARVPDRGRRFVGKIDVEGHELRTLAGATSFLTGNEGVLQIECFPGRQAELMERMSELGYERVFWMSADHIFSNLQAERRREILEIGLDEMANALADLKTLRRLRRDAVRKARATLEAVRYGRDPVRVRSTPG